MHLGGSLLGSLLWYIVLWLILVQQNPGMSNSYVDKGLLGAKGGDSSDYAVYTPWLLGIATT